MKKIVFSISMILSSVWSFSQDVDLSYLRPIGESITTTENSLYTNFVSSSNIFTTYSSLEVTSSEIDLVTVEDTSVKVLVVPITGVGTSNKLVVFYNSIASDYMFFFMEYTSSESGPSSNLYDEQNQLVYRTAQTESSFDLSLESGTSCFGSCMDRQEAHFESTLAGYIYWNWGPQAVVVQAMAAANCTGCCKGWWRNKGC